MTRLMSEILVEGFCMLLVAICGVCLNISSVIYFAQLRQQRPFHRCFVVPCKDFDIIYHSRCRLLLTLAVTDTIHLIASALTFSIANLSEDYASNEWNYIVPYSLPVAQVLDRSIFKMVFIALSDLYDVQRLSDYISHCGEILLRCEAIL